MWNVGLEMLKNPFHRSGLDLGSSICHGVVPVWEIDKWGAGMAGGSSVAPYTFTHAILHVPHRIYSMRKNNSLNLGNTL